MPLMVSPKINYLTPSLLDIRDMPINDNRNIAIGLGLGINYNVLFTNLQFNDDMTTNVVSSDVINQWNSTEVEIALEFRWRNQPDQLSILACVCRVGYYYALSAEQYTNSGSLKSTVPLRLKLQIGISIKCWKQHMEFDLFLSD